MQNTGIIFIPDISGFTDFVTSTEVRHSSHIISELIEEIIRANTLDLKISEIEGDAVLFYKLGDPPDLKSVISQVQKMFIAFHNYLKIIERDNVCRCGACQNASRLTLKFILHFGEFQKVVIQDHIKLMGADVILAHRLLKNNTPVNQYFLYSDTYSQTQNDDDLSEFNWVCVEMHEEKIEKFNDLKVHTIDLTKLLSMVEVPPADQQIEELKGDYKISIDISAPLNEVHGVLIDQESKYHWVEGIKSVENDSPINRVNSSHTCVFDNLEISFNTKPGKSEENTINFVEEADTGFGFGIISDYKLTKQENGTRLQLRFMPSFFEKNRSFFSKLILRIKYQIVLRSIIKNSRRNLKNFKKYCEEKFGNS